MCFSRVVPSTMLQSCYTIRCVHSHKAHTIAQGLLGILIKRPAFIAILQPSHGHSSLNFRECTCYTFFPVILTWLWTLLVMRKMENNMTLLFFLNAGWQHWLEELHIFLSERTVDQKQRLHHVSEGILFVVYHCISLNASQHRSVYTTLHCDLEWAIISQLERYHREIWMLKRHWFPATWLAVTS